MLAVCGGYQLLGRFYRDRYGAELPGRRAPAAPHGRRRAPDDRRRPARVRARAGERGRSPGFENHAGRTILDEGAEPLGRVVAGFGNDGDERLRGLPRRAASSAPTCTGRCCRATRGSPTGCSRRRSRTDRRRAAVFEPLDGRARGARRTRSRPRARAARGGALLAERSHGCAHHGRARERRPERDVARAPLVGANRSSYRAIARNRYRRSSSPDHALEHPPEPLRPRVDLLRGFPASAPSRTPRPARRPRGDARAPRDQQLGRPVHRLRHADEILEVPRLRSPAAGAREHGLGAPLDVRRTAASGPAAPAAPCA